MSPTMSTREVFDGPAVYRIRVQGRIGEDWADRLCGMRIIVIVPEAAQPVTTLVGELRDQAALAGVLSTIYGLHLPVLSVRRLSAGVSHGKAH